MKNIYIVGFMGAGKTTVAKLLAKKLGRPFVETDDLIEQRVGKKIVDIFTQDGEPYFREQERSLLKELAAQSNLVVSCGGGLICNEENLEILKESGIVANLKATAKTIYERTRHYTHRPLLNVDSAKEKIESLLNQRAPYYRQAHHCIDTEEISPKEVVNKIIKILKKTNN